MRNEILRFNRIRNLREDNELTQKQVAAYLNVTQNTYSQYEIGERNMPISIVIKLAQFYNTNVDYLYGLTDEKRPYPRK